MSCVQGMRPRTNPQPSEPHASGLPGIFATWDGLKDVGDDGLKAAHRLDRPGRMIRVSLRRAVASGVLWGSRRRGLPQGGLEILHEFGEGKRHG